LELIPLLWRMRGNECENKRDLSGLCVAFWLVPIFSFATAPGLHAMLSPVHGADRLGYFFLEEIDAAQKIP